MLTRILQECTHITLRPRHINSLNNVLTGVIALEHPEEQLEALAVVIRTISNLKLKMQKSEVLLSFLHNKLCVIVQIALRNLLVHDTGNVMNVIAAAVRQADNKKSVLAPLIKETIHTTEQVKQNSRRRIFEHFFDSQMLELYLVQVIQLLPSLREIYFSNIVALVTDLPPLSALTPSSRLFQVKKQYQKLLLLVLSTPALPNRLVLYSKLGEQMLSKMDNPLILSQHLLKEFESDLETRIEVLACLFILVGKYGLSFEEFYPKLQALIQCKNTYLSVYEFPNSKRFFKLLESSLKSSRVPLKTVLSILKTIIAQVFCESNEFSYWAASFLVNLTKKHRKLLDYLLQLPEINLLRHHYSPKIQALLAELEGNLNRVEYLDIQLFAHIDCAALTQSKAHEAIFILQKDPDTEFKAIDIYEPL